MIEKKEILLEIKKSFNRIQSHSIFISAFSCMFFILALAVNNIHYTLNSNAFFYITIAFALTSLRLAYGELK